MQSTESSSSTERVPWFAKNHSQGPEHGHSQGRNTAGAYIYHDCIDYTPIFLFFARRGRNTFLLYSMKLAVSCAGSLKKKTYIAAEEDYFFL
jgi:hypothetical protein